MSITLLEDKRLDQVVGGALTLFVGQNSGSPNILSATVYDAAHDEIATISFMHAVIAPDAAVPGALTAFGNVAQNTDIANITVGVPQ